MLFVCIVLDTIAGNMGDHVRSIIFLGKYLVIIAIVIARTYF